MSRPERGARRSSLRRSLGAIALDVTPLRESRDFRPLMVGQIVSGLGTQIALVALPYQIFVLSHSAALVGLLGAFELGPMIVASLLGGAIADRLDRRKVLIGAQFAIILTAAAGRGDAGDASCGARRPRDRRPPPRRRRSCARSAMACGSSLTTRRWPGASRSTSLR